MITGAAMAMNYGLATLVHDSIESLTQWPGDSSEMDDRAWRRRTAAADVGAMLAGFALQTAFQQHPGETLLRGGARTTGFVLSATGFAGAATAMIQEGMQILDERANSRWRLRSLPWAIASGAAFSLIQQQTLRRRYSKDDGLLLEDRGEESAPRALVTSALVSAGLVGISSAERKFAALTSEGLSRVSSRAGARVEGSWTSAFAWVNGHGNDRCIAPRLSPCGVGGQHARAGARS